MRRGRRLSWIACVLAAALLGCAPIGGTTPPSRFYLLTSLEAPPPRTNGPGLGVGPVRIAEYLDRPQIVTRRG